MASMDFENESRPYEGGRERDYDNRDRSASPGRRGSPGRDNGRVRSASPGGRGGDRGATSGGIKEESGAINTGTNLFVTGIHPRLNEQDVIEMFSEYGPVEKCQIMLDPHTKESRGFGFVKMATLEGADGAKDTLQGKVIEGRTLSIEKARRNRPRTPTPGKYFGPPKKDDFRGGRRGGGGFGGGRFDDRPPRRYDDDRRGGGGYERRYDDRRGGGDDRDRRYGGGDRHDRYARDDRGGDDYRSRDIDRYASRGDDAYSRGSRDDRRSGYDREGGGGASAAPSASGGSGYDRRGGGEERSGYRA